MAGPHFAKRTPRSLPRDHGAPLDVRHLDGRGARLAWAWMHQVKVCWAAGDPDGAPRRRVASGRGLAGRRSSSRRSGTTCLRLWLPLVLVGLIAVGCTGAAAGPTAAPFESDAVGTHLLLSTSADRSFPRAFNGATVSGTVYVTFEPDEPIERVVFRIDATDVSDPIESVERLAPYDLGGGGETAADGFDTRALPDGTHRLDVTAIARSGQERAFVAWFEVRNGAATVVPGDLYVAPDGSDTDPGTIHRPLRTVQAAVDRARPGTVIYLRGGTYVPSDSIAITRPGAKSEPIRLLAYPGEHVTIDGSALANEDPVLRIRASYWVVKGIELKHGPWFGIFLQDAEYNHFEDVSTHHHGHSGVHLQERASFNTFVHVDAYANFDPASGGQNADGFAIKRRSARGNVLLLCRAWNNSDDGFDLLESAPQRIDRSVAFRNGYREDGTPYPNGNGNGFKLGIGDGQWEAGGGHTITRSVAWGNETWGFNSNNGTIPIHAYNNTAWDNGVRNFLFNKAAHVLINNVSYGARVAVAPEVIQKRNTWQLGIDDPEFASLDPGSPEFLRLAASSPAVSAGLDVGLEYAGDAPDLGAFESPW